ncbi:MAG: NAD(P)H:quinone oxidoreductase [Alphaproteobacteria bacterium]|jgi:NAD(P)H dehydrogenase (quinone)|nr:NAD(P)H:quinone oxidoreductase [Alphaproteobacteria bacterium]MBT4083117.1 NAD(P)H:quinone oxidoreductase [Alphaproteobacteria bacterium]MBT4542373.1 NAD(P)H:quinone oxidoreductase [Alphaproteobacteria bacterium]MBT5160003.1 NAD(P)H:quinone oxidoreductase [Alphaproteobacteria bacterium]MBT7747268.1 NAD(P)H:quinone oxidoreductase [Alphaproteobacteria bacterium]
MTRVLVLFHSWTGGTYRLAEALAEGARSVDGVDVVVKQVPEVVSSEVLDSVGATEARKVFADVPVVNVDELPDYDGFAFGTPTRFGNMSSTMRSFLDQTGRFYVDGILAAKPATVFCSTGTGGGMETTITSFWNTLAHHGMTIVPLGYRAQEIRDVTVAHGGSPYGAGAMARLEDPRGKELELGAARTQGRVWAEIAQKQSR